MNNIHLHIRVTLLISVQMLTDMKLLVGINHVNTDIQIQRDDIYK